MQIIYSPRLQGYIVLKHHENGFGRTMLATASTRLEALAKALQRITKSNTPIVA